MNSGISLDWVIATLPRVTPNAPTIGPALLKAVLQQSGYSCLTLDLNNDLFHRTKNFFPQIWLSQDTTFSPNSNTYEDFLKAGFSEILDEWAKRLLDYKAEFVGLSLLSDFSGSVCKSLVDRIRAIQPDQKIVIGGPGANFLGPELLQSKRIDFYIQGEAEKVILALSRGQTDMPGINSKGEQLTNEELEQVPYADYSDYAQNLYSPKNSASNIEKLPSLWRRMEKMHNLFVTMSRGCVRSCSFCDVGTQWPRFRRKSGAHVAREMYYYKKQFGANMIEFTDSLVNGSLTDLKALCENLIELKKTEGPIRWKGQFVCRSKELFPDSYYQLMKDAGCEYLFVGIETGSETVRKHMKKYFKNEDVFHMIKQTADLKEVTFLMMVGYPTETEIEFQETLDFLEKVAAIPGSENIVVSCSIPVVIIPGTPLWESAESMGIKNKETIHYWELGDNTFDVRSDRYFRMMKKTEELGLNNNIRHSEQLKLAKFRESNPIPQTDVSKPSIQHQP